MYEMFHTILSFCSILAWSFSCAMSGKFVQWWRSSWSNRFYRKINQSKKKLVKSDVLFYFYIFIWWIRTELICQLSNKKLFKNDIIVRRHCAWFFPLQCCLESLWEHCTNFYLCNVVPRVLRQHWTGFFPVL